MRLSLSYDRILWLRLRQCMVIYLLECEQNRFACILSLHPSIEQPKDEVSGMLVMLNAIMHKRFSLETDNAVSSCQKWLVRVS